MNKDAFARLLGRTLKPSFNLALGAASIIIVFVSVITTLVFCLDQSIPTNGYTSHQRAHSMLLLVADCAYAFKNFRIKNKIKLGQAGKTGAVSIRSYVDADTSSLLDAKTLNELVFRFALIADAGRTDNVGTFAGCALRRAGTVKTVAADCVAGFAFGEVCYW